MSGSTPPLTLSNATARHLWLHCQGMAAPPRGGAVHAELLATVERLGMVQLDPLAVVARAHHHILWSRHGGYRPRHFDVLLEQRRDVFEHFTHDAAILPMTLWPWWSRARALRAERYARGTRLPGRRERDAIVERVAREGPLRSRDFEGRAERRLQTWQRPPHKRALEYLWLEGRLAVSHRRGFAKCYDLVERVIPAALRDEEHDESEQVDKLCRMALARLGVATPGELQRFWNACSGAEVTRWMKENPRAWRPVRYAGADGAMHAAIAPADVEDVLARLSPVAGRARVVNPFDPVARDRDRLARLFGFDYRIEIYVPPAKRRYGYYVYPVLDGARFTGRIEVRRDPAGNRLAVSRWWPEPGVRDGGGRRLRLERELRRVARLADVAWVDPLPTTASAPGPAVCENVRPFDQP